jgi:hypothetical protein
MSLWFALELNSILNDIAHMSCNENTYIEDISLHLISADLFGSPRIACLMAISEWMRYGPVLKSTHGVVVRSRLKFIVNDIAAMPCNENTYIEVISLHLGAIEFFDLSVMGCWMAISEWIRHGPVLKSTHVAVVRSRTEFDFERDRSDAM